MTIKSTGMTVAGGAVLESRIFSDARGSFETFWNESDLKKVGIKFKPANAHHSYNLKTGTVRAFHYQREPHGQAKLVTCVSGRIWDVVVDLRAESPTLHRWAAVELKAGDGKAVYVPSGCAHGYVTLEDHSTVAYLIEGEYIEAASAVIRWNDPILSVPWPVKDPILSDRDRNAPFLDK